MFAVSCMSSTVPEQCCTVCCVVHCSSMTYFLRELIFIDIYIYIYIYMCVCVCVCVSVSVCVWLWVCVSVFVRTESVLKLLCCLWAESQDSRSTIAVRSKSLQRQTHLSRHTLVSYLQISFNKIISPNDIRQLPCCHLQMWWQTDIFLSVI